MMMTHRIVLKTHPLLTTHVRSVHSILFQEWVSKRRSDCKRDTEESQRATLVFPTRVGSPPKVARAGRGGLRWKVVEKENPRLAAILA
jgi:hypothetical protein